MSFRASALIAVLALVIVQARVAHACSPSGWGTDDSELPDCVQVAYLAHAQIELSNTCSDDLTLVNDDCATCTIPDTIRAGSTGVIELVESPEENLMVEIEFESGDVSGVIVSEYRYNPCPDNEGGCAVASRSGPQSAWLVLLALAAARVVYRRRSYRSLRAD